MYPENSSDGVGLKSNGNDLSSGAGWSAGRRDYGWMFIRHCKTGKHTLVMDGLYMSCPLRSGKPATRQHWTIESLRSDWTWTGLRTSL